jgi:hypothetical protein
MAIAKVALTEFHDRIDRLRERERRSMLRAFDELILKIPARTVEAVDGELSDLRQARQAGGRGNLGRPRYVRPD